MLWHAHPRNNNQRPPFRTPAALILGPCASKQQDWYWRHFHSYDTCVPSVVPGARVSTASSLDIMGAPRLFIHLPCVKVRVFHIASFGQLIPDRPPASRTIRGLPPNEAQIRFCPLCRCGRARIPQFRFLLISFVVLDPIRHTEVHSGDVGMYSYKTLVLSSVFQHHHPLHSHYFDFRRDGLPFTPPLEFLDLFQEPHLPN